VLLVKMRANYLFTNQISNPNRVVLLQV
jgi:hypothetical protein